MACMFNVTGGTLAPEEKKAYIARAVELYGSEPDAIDAKIDGEFVDLSYHYKTQPFHRIRRITGYLGGTRDRFNDAKRAEEHDRVKHDLSL